MNLVKGCSFSAYVMTVFCHWRAPEILDEDGGVVYSI